MPLKIRLAPLVGLIFCVALANRSSSSALPAQVRDREKQAQLQQEEREDYYGKWLNQDVAYIITPQEQDVFKKLLTANEKEQFIEQFWRRRDPDLSSAINEVKEEHYRRIAYADERFTSGVPGWKTDRGRIYIIHGQPAEIESHRQGESYDRPSQEGGGLTKTYPFEIWRYRHLEGIGTDIEVEFVDPSGSGEFRLSRNPWEKDALLLIPGSGRTVAESLGLMRRSDHPYFAPTNADRYPGMHLRAQDNPFTRYETLAKLQSPQPIKYTDLKELVTVDVSYDDLPFRVRPDYFRLNEQRVLVPITIEVDNKNLSFTSENGVYVARVAVYGIVTSMTNRLIDEFEDELMVSYQPQFFNDGLLSRSVYQKVLPLNAKLRYKLDFVLKDLNSQKSGVKRQGIIPPGHLTDKLASSSVILSDYVRPLGETPNDEQMFVIGDIKVRPNLTNVFSPQKPLWIYLHLYNVALDQTSFAPSLAVTYRILQDGEEVVKTVDEGGRSVQFYSAGRVVLIKRLPVRELPPDRYRIELELQDRISGQKLALHSEFQLQPSRP